MPYPQAYHRVLLLEDDDLLRDLFAHWLEFSGIPVDAVGDCAAARDLLRERAYTRALLDLHVPDGLATELLPLLPDAAVLILTGNPYEDALRQACEAGWIHAVLEKPISLGQLLEELDRFAPPPREPEEDSECAHDG